MKIQAKFTINNKEYSGTIEADETAFAPAKERGIFRPKPGSTYWRISDEGKFESDVFDSYFECDAWDVISGNIFRTREDAQKRLDVIHAENRIREYLDAHPEMYYEPDKGTTDEKYFAAMRCGEVGVGWDHDMPIGVNIYFARTQLCDQFNKDNADDLKLIAEFGGFRR